MELISSALRRVGRGSPLPVDLQQRVQHDVLAMHQNIGNLVAQTADWIEYVGRRGHR